MKYLRPDNCETQESSLLSSLYAAALLVLLLFGGSTMAAEVTVEPIEQLSEEELVDLVSPIALYPDDLLAIVLPATTYPLQIVQAARFLEARELDSSLEPDEDWDDSIIALLNYPEVIDLLNEDLDWTWQLGEAVLVQESEMIAAVSEFRERARIAGNLESDDRQIVALDDDGAIEIKPADPEVIYVPYYEPARVTVYQRSPVYHYYPRAYPVYYYPYAAGHHFSTGFFWGVTSAFSIGWRTHHLHLHHYGYAGHPYYRHTYHDPYYYRRPHLWLGHSYASYYDQHHRRHNNRRHHGGNHWQPDHERAGSRPHDRGGDNWQRDRRHGRPLMDDNSARQVAERRERRTEGKRTEAGRIGHRTTLNRQNRVTMAPENQVPGARTTRDNTNANNRQARANPRPENRNRRTNTENRATLERDLSDKKVMERPAPRINTRNTTRNTTRSTERRKLNEPNAPRVRVATGNSRRSTSKPAPAPQVRRNTNARQQVTVAPANNRRANTAPRPTVQRKAPRAQTRSVPRTAPRSIQKAEPKRQPRNTVQAPVMRQPRAVAAAPARRPAKPQKAAPGASKSEKPGRRRSDNRQGRRVN